MWFLGGFMLKKSRLFFKRQSGKSVAHAPSRFIHYVDMPANATCLVVYLMQNLRLMGRPPPIIFARIVRPINALQLCR